MGNNTILNEINDELLDGVNGGSAVLEKDCYGEMKVRKVSDPKNTVTKTEASIPVAGVERLSTDGMAKTNGYM